MATNLAIDPKLLQKALDVSGLKTKKETVNLALQEFINRHKQLELLDLFGKMDPDPNYDYKKGRTR
jgi:Arc/MetJ family transcription regulator